MSAIFVANLLIAGALGAPWAGVARLPTSGEKELVNFVRPPIDLADIPPEHLAPTVPQPVSAPVGADRLVMATGQEGQNLVGAEHPMTGMMVAGMDTVDAAGEDAAGVEEGSSEAMSTPFPSWIDYMALGIQTGIEFANSGAAVPAGTVDPSTVFSALSQQTADAFTALLGEGEG